MDLITEHRSHSAPLIWLDPIGPRKAVPLVCTVLIVEAGMLRSAIQGTAVRRGVLRGDGAFAQAGVERCPGSHVTGLWSLG